MLAPCQNRSARALHPPAPNMSPLLITCLRSLRPRVRQVPEGTFSEATRLRLWVVGLNRAGLQTACNDTFFWVDLSPPNVHATVIVGKENIACWDRISGRFPIRWHDAFKDPESGIAAYFWALGTLNDPERYVPRTAAGLALNATAYPTFTPGDTVVATVWAVNPTGMEQRARSRELRVDPEPPQPALPIAVRDVSPSGSRLDADIDFQNQPTAVAAQWSGWTTSGWVVEYYVAVEASNGTASDQLCERVSVGNATNATSAAVCGHGPLRHGWTYRWRVEAVGCNNLTTIRRYVVPLRGALPGVTSAPSGAQGPAWGTPVLPLVQEAPTPTERWHQPTSMTCANRWPI